MQSVLTPLTWGNCDHLIDAVTGRLDHKNSTDDGFYLSGIRKSTNSIRHRAKTRQDDPQLYSILHKMGYFKSCPFQKYRPNPLSDPHSPMSQSVAAMFTWNTWPEDVRVGASLDGLGRGGLLPSSRKHRKEKQLNNIMSFVVPLLAAHGYDSHYTSTGDNSLLIPTLDHLPASAHDIPDINAVVVDADTIIGAGPCTTTTTTTTRLKVVDFCCGCGHQSIPLAYLYPEVEFVLLDMKAASLEIAKDRVLRLGLRNVRFLEGIAENFVELFDIAISLHACGAASDVILQKCISVGAAYVSIPCCVGKVNQYRNPKCKADPSLSLPRSASSTCCSVADTTSITFPAEASSHDGDITGRAISSSEVQVSISRSTTRPSSINSGSTTTVRTSSSSSSSSTRSSGSPRSYDRKAASLFNSTSITCSSDICYPRSEVVRSLLSLKEYQQLAKAADFGHYGYNTTASNAIGTQHPNADRTNKNNNDNHKDDNNSKPNSNCDDNDTCRKHGFHTFDETATASDACTVSPAGASTLTATAATGAAANDEIADRGDSGKRDVERTVMRRRAKCSVELDRQQYAQELGYQTWLMVCEPASCTPKNDILVGIPASKCTIVDYFESWCGFKCPIE